MKITIDNQEFEKITSTSRQEGNCVYYKGNWYKPVKKYLFTTEDGVDIYESLNTYYNHVNLETWEIQESFSAEEGSGKLNSSKYKYFSTKEKALEYIDKHKPKEWKILEFADILNRFYKKENGKFTINLQYEYDEKQLLNIPYSKTVFISKVKRIRDGEIFSLEDRVDSSVNIIEKFELKNNNILVAVGKPNSLDILFIDKIKPLFKDVKGNDIYKGDTIYIIPSSYLFPIIFTSFNVNYDVKNYKNVFKKREDAQEYINSIKLKKYTFGGHDCTFVLYQKSNTNDNYVEVTFKDITGTHFQIEEILKNYFRPCRFGKVQVQSFSLKDKAFSYKNPGNIYSIPESMDIDNVDTITIGCVTGTYKELNNIYNYCLNLLNL